MMRRGWKIMIDALAMRRRRDEIDSKLVALNSEVNELHRELNDIELALVRHDHPCRCVRLNSDIGVHSMADQADQRREPLTAGGFVSNTLTASATCQVCDGTGKPRVNEMAGNS